MVRTFVAIVSMGLKKLMEVVGRSFRVSGNNYGGDWLVGINCSSRHCSPDRA
jgi:hypothetical protein